MPQIFKTWSVVMNKTYLPQKFVPNDLVFLSLPVDSYLQLSHSALSTTNRYVSSLSPSDKNTLPGDQAWSPKCFFRIHLPYLHLPWASHRLVLQSRLKSVSLGLDSRKTCVTLIQSCTKLTTKSTGQQVDSPPQPAQGPRQLNVPAAWIQDL